MKTAFLIHGFRLNITAAHARYNDLKTALESKGYRVAPVNITWNYRTVSKFADGFVDFYKAHKSEHNLIVGNSLGAMTAFVSTPLIVPNELILCSLSPFFSEDLNKHEPVYVVHRFGKQRAEDFTKLSANKIAEQISQKNIRTTFLYGEKEKEMYPTLVARVKASASQVKSSRLIEIPNAGHPMHEPEYVAGIKKALG